MLILLPRLIVSRNDTLTTGIVYMPVGIANFCYLMSYNSIETQVVDLFGQSPTECEITEQNLIFGTQISEIDNLNLPDQTDIAIYANQASNHSEVSRIIEYVLMNANKDARIYLLENSQAVTAYSLLSIRKLIPDRVVILTGTPEDQLLRISNILKFKSHLPPYLKAEWQKIPIEKYWKYNLSHGPKKRDRYLPYLSSYGCPWSCEFCVVPGTNYRKWRGKTPEEVFNELSFLKEKFQVTEFHFEDLNPTVDENRIIEMSRKITPLDIVWKIVAGTKSETISSFENLKELANSGLRYLSISPESGSIKIRSAIGKRFNDEHAFELIKWSKRLNVNTQACFVLGMPNESWSDRISTLSLIRKITWIGISEIAVFIISPMPGSKLYGQEKSELLNLSFSPKWRSDYRKLFTSRLYWYLNFLTLKTIRHPILMFRSLNARFSGKFELKMEMAPYRSAQWKKWMKNAC